MSTLAAAKADNFYFPPEYKPSDGSLNKFRKSHGALGKRANKLHLGILVIRFEVPWNMWCTTCKAHIGRGVRYNAEKKHVDNYFSTKIYEFSMKCHLCAGLIVFRTDPKNTEFLIMKGAQRKTETWSAKDSETTELQDDEEKKKMKFDPMFALEHREESKVRAVEANKSMKALVSVTNRMKDDFAASQLLRQKFRTKKKEIAAEKQESASKGLAIALLPKNDEDLLHASRVNFQKDQATQNSKLKRLHVSGSIFGSKGNSEHAGVMSAIEKQIKYGINPKRLKPVDISHANSRKLKFTTTRSTSSTTDVQSYLPLLQSFSPASSSTSPDVHSRKRKIEPT